MMRFKYKIDHGSFASLNEFEDYLNRMGLSGYELIQYKEVDGDYMISNFGSFHVCRPRSIHFVITWKIETP